ncbi:MAG: glucosidase [Planctomycetota bacterium]
MNREQRRLEEAYSNGAPWRRWGPYLSDRQWGTVREDYSADGDAWAHFPHDHARSRAYRWGEDGLLGICDEEQRLCFAVALWNGVDPILKERLFGLTNAEGNHGEDVKELYYYLDSTPTHSSMRALYKYPQRRFPYEDLVETNRDRGYEDHEYELVDTGAFDGDRYFDVYVEYAKAGPDDVLIEIEVCNRGPEDAGLRVLPTLWFRNTWGGSSGAERPSLEDAGKTGGARRIAAHHPELGSTTLLCEGDVELRFTENETNAERLFGEPSRAPHVKDAIDRFVVHGEASAVSPEGRGTKVAADYDLTVPAGGSRTIRLRLVHEQTLDGPAFGADFDEVLRARREDADSFYRELLTSGLDRDELAVCRQAFAGLLWTKQYYEFDVKSWLDDGGGGGARNVDWAHVKCRDIISMPDKWEYPWFAVWDLAFHCIPLMLVDVDFAKAQLSMFLEPRYQRDDGAIPAYEWNFSDVNPPVHAWATLAVYQYEKSMRDGEGDKDFLKFMFDGLCRNFEWWLSRKAIDGTDVFGGGFLGLDNIGVFDRSKALPTGGHLEQSDGTSWMVVFAQTMLRISLEMCRVDPGYEDRALQFLERVIAIAGALDPAGDREDEMWDEADGFFYDVLRFPDGRATRLHVRSLIGLLPLAAISIFEAETLAALPRLRARLDELSGSPQTSNIHCPSVEGVSGRRMISILDESRLRRVLGRMLDESEFLSAYGVRSLSRYHLESPYVFHWEGKAHEVRYLPAESDSGMFGGNSNWRGPVWIPVNHLLLRGLVYLHSFYGDDFRIECPTSSGVELSLLEVADEIGRRLSSIFRLDDDGRRPVHGASTRLQEDERLRDSILFYEYFNGDDGAGIGASHQTGWTGCIAMISLGLDLLTSTGSALHSRQRSHRRPPRRATP